MGNLLSITKSVSLKILITYRICKWLFLWFLIQQGYKSKYLTNILYSEINGVFSQKWSYLDYCVKRTYLISWLRVFPLLVELYCFLLLQENRSKEDDRHFNYLSYVLSEFIKLMKGSRWNYFGEYSIMAKPATKLYESLDKIFQLKKVNTDDLDNLEDSLFEKNMLQSFQHSGILTFFIMMKSFHSLP